MSSPPELTPITLAAALGVRPPTPEQAAVIAAPVEPALVVAGAGAGKTETMAARVVWLVATRRVGPERVLGLTFTRKAARQLGDRVRARLRRLAGSPLLPRLDPDGTLRAALQVGEPTVLTYHAYAGRLVAEHGLRLPVEPGARLLSETTAWQVAHRVVAGWADDLEVDWAPATVTGKVLALAGELAEHLADPAALVEHAARFAQLIEAAPRAARQRADLPAALRDKITAQRTRVALLPLVDEYAAAKRRERAMDFADQMALAARLAAGHPEVGAMERDRFGAVLLDEYQDTGHAQRILLRELFGLGADAAVPITAVGDPAQAIYGWRGASAANLPRFTTDFPRREPGPGGERRAPATTYPMLTSFRNPPEVLAVANAVSAPLRAGPVAVDELVARPDAPPGDIRVALLPDVLSEVEWVADGVAAAWFAALDAIGEDGGPGQPPTAAVLVRRRADSARIAAALRERGLPVEVVGLGGLLDEPEVRDLVSLLRLLVDPLAGTAAVRLLTGARWRLGAADLVALWRRARELSAVDTSASDPIAAALPGEEAEQAGLLDAIHEPGPADRYSADGFARLRSFATELASLRRRLDVPLPELVADAERVLGVDVEVAARPGGVGRVHLDAFAGVVADFAADALAGRGTAATLTALLDHLATAEQAEDGLEPGEVDVAPDRVQVLTVHAAKGLEWQVVAVPQLVDKVFPPAKRSSSWLGTPTALPADLRGDSADLPVLNLAGCANRKDVEEELAAHEDAFEARRLTEERRLLYVALTRSEGTLLVSGHWWSDTAAMPRGPSEFLLEVRDAVVAAGAGTVGPWADPPDDGSENPVAAGTRVVLWPVDPLGARRADVAAGATLVRAALTRLRAAQREQEPLPGFELGADEPDESDVEGDPEDWARDVDVLLAERAASMARRQYVELPRHLSVSQLVELAADPDELARRLRRPVPQPPNPVARRGTAFHAWLERRFRATTLLDVDELPGAADDSAPVEQDLERLQRAFLAGRWGNRYPDEVEVPFETDLAGVLLRGRMDAVFADPDGGWTVVDWKTGSPPPAERQAAVSVQLAAYRLAWASLAGVPVQRVRAAFHYVAADITVAPVDLLDVDGLAALLTGLPVRQ